MNPTTICRTLLFFSILFSFTTMAQTQKGEFINAHIGLGVSASYADIDLQGTGLYAQAEYVWGFRTWFSLRPYIGVIFTDTDQDEISENLRGFEVSNNAFLFGGKFRIAAPILYVAPYLELGLGASAGSFVTRTPWEDIDRKGVLVHIPFTLGLALGKHNRVGLELSYYFTPAAKQFSGALALGLAFPINRSKNK